MSSDDLPAPARIAGLQPIDRRLKPAPTRFAGWHIQTHIACIERFGNVGRSQARCRETPTLLSAYAPEAESRHTIREYHPHCTDCIAHISCFPLTGVKS